MQKYYNNNTLIINVLLFFLSNYLIKKYICFAFIIISYKLQTSKEKLSS